MIGVVDESTPQVAGGVVYSLALVTFDPVTSPVGEALRTALNRTRPVHWEADKGAQIRTKLVDVLATHDIRIHVAATATPANRQVHARRELLERWLLPAARSAGVDELVIEQRSQSEDNAERSVIRNWYRQQRVDCPLFVHVPKSDPRVWPADIASGFWSDLALGRVGGWFEQLAAAGRIGLAVNA